LLNRQPPEGSEPSEGSEQQRIYRRSAYEQKGRVTPVDAVVRVSAPREWLVLILLAVIIAAVITWSVVGRLESGVRAACELRPAGERYAVATSAPGVVVETLAVPGTQVRAGDPLLRLAAPEISLDAELAQARSVALAAQHPGSVEAVAAAAEAEALQAAEAATTLLLSPANGVVGPQLAPAGTAANAGTVVAEVLDTADASPTVILFMAPTESARTRPSMAVSVNITAAGETDTIRAEGRISELRAAAGLAATGNTALRPASLARAGTLGDSAVAVELDDAPDSFRDLALGSQAAYSCDAHIVTDSQRPIRLLLGRG